jgi:hypothetical protein
MDADFVPLDPSARDSGQYIHSLKEPTPKGLTLFKFYGKFSIRDDY